MSKIDKMSILGIRSFDNTKGETIKFFSPLTLIVGSNGSGKTTIIECLKYATTGDQPPNTKGGAFIHDPKLAGEREVLAQVKISFLGTSGARMVATRNLQLTVKKGARTMKTLEGSLLMLKDGERHSVSTRVAELDQVVPQYLGASKAILDNVVFCHQDESLWPLSEPGTLKKKFDEIFEAQKYTKAIENIKVLRKNRTIELKELKIRQENEQENKNRADKAEKRTRELESDLDKLRETWKNLGEDLKTAGTKAQESWDKAGQFDRLIVQLDGKRTEAKIKEESIEDARQEIEEMSESDDALQNMLDQQDDRSRNYQRDIKSKSRAYEDVIKRTKDAQGELERKRTAYGKYEAEHAQYQRQVEQRTALVKDTAARHSIRGFDYDLDDNRVRDFLGKISSMARDQERTRKRAHDDAQKEIGEAQHALDGLNAQKTKLVSSKENARSQINNLDRKLQNQQTNLNRIEVDEGAQARLESSTSDSRAQLESLKDKVDKANWVKQVHDAEASLRDLESQREELESEVLRATKHANETAEIDHLRKSLRSTNDSLSSMKGAHGTELGKLLGASWDKDLEQQYDDICRQRAEELSTAQKQQDGSQRELDQVDFRLRTTQDSLKKRTAEAQKCEKQIRDALDDEDPKEFLAIMREQETARDELSNEAHIVDYYQKSQSYLTTDNACRLCERPFVAEKEKQVILKKFKKFLAADAKEREAELEQTKETLATLRELNPTYETWVRLRDKDVPSMTKECQALEGERAKIIQKMEQQHDPRITQCKDAKYEADKSSKNVQAIVKYENDLKALKKQINDLSNKQSQSGVASRGLDEISEQQKSINEKLKTARSTLNLVRSERESAQERINQLEIDMRDAQAKLSQAASQLKEKQSLQAQIDELIGSRNEQRESIGQSDRQLQALVPNITSAQTKFDDLNRRAAERQSQLSGEASKTQNSMNQLQSAQNEITAYLDRQGPQQLARTDKEIAEIKNDQSNIEQEQLKLTVEINKLKQEEAKQAEHIRGIQRNLKYRRDKKTLDQLRIEIQGLEANNAEADRDTHNREANKWQNKLNKLSADQSGIAGQMKTKDDQLAELITDYKTMYQDAAHKFREATVRHTATKYVIEDLGRYGGALDKAIMQYHSLKMDEINALIEELWQKTYKGTDIDTILIRSDNEGGKGNKSYNYRVCMIKQDVEMDMRGRCSAGQKVLACIIIRLALAECFGVSCGLIALDEPTTNLDRDNIISLANSLHGIIKHRKEQKNFQLIVITHDEEFLAEMRCSDFCDHYFRVSRNAKQKSEIALQSISAIDRAG